VRLGGDRVGRRMVFFFFLIAAAYGIGMDVRVRRGASFEIEI
jgi:hypothetical protein